MVENFDVECSRERLREIWRRTLTWNMVENGDVEYGGEWWCEMWWRTVRLGRNA